MVEGRKERMRRIRKKGRKNDRGKERRKGGGKEGRTLDSSYDTPPVRVRAWSMCCHTCRDVTLTFPIMTEFNALEYKKSLILPWCQVQKGGGYINVMCKGDKKGDI